MPQARVLVVTGLPGAGKTTLAAVLAVRLQWPLLSKDSVKGPLLAALEPVDAVRSRQLSDVSFALLFALAGAQLAAGAHGLVLEGNFRAGEHEPSLHAALTAAGEGAARCAQILCRVDPAERLRRLVERAAAQTAAPVHHDLRAQLGPHGPDGAAPSDRFLDLPGPRHLCSPAGGDAPEGLLRMIEQWIASST